MSENYTAQPGDYMELIAEKFGFRDYRIIYDHPNNSHIKKFRPNPHILYPGDSIFIPDMDPGHEPADTDKKHKFVLKSHKIKLILYIRRNGKPFANQSYKLTVGLQTQAGKTAADGLIEKDIPVGEPVGVLTFTGSPPYTRKLNLGFLHPISKRSGRQMRLNNLGFGCGAPSGDESDAYTAAIRAFQRRYQLTVTGSFNQHTLDKLRSEYELDIPS
ncbi:MAG: peptidoglycan-binding domain-containing protein [Bryobacteraceae bacterium]